MMEQLIELDKQLLLFFNGSHTPFWDNFFYTFSGTAIWVPIAVLILGVIVKTKKKEALCILLFLAVAIVLSDQISSLIKNLVERPRPSREVSLQDLVQTVNGYRGGAYGFISSHAANSFAFAIFSTLLFRHSIYGITIFVWATFNSYSRMYLGVHYPGDILGGIVLGLLLGGLMFWSMKKICPKTLEQKQTCHYTQTGFSFISIYGILAGIFLTILAISLTSF